MQACFLIGAGGFIGGGIQGNISTQITEGVSNDAYVGGAIAGGKGGAIAIKVGGSDAIEAGGGSGFFGPGLGIGGFVKLCKSCTGCGCDFANSNKKAAKCVVGELQKIAPNGLKGLFM